MTFRPMLACEADLTNLSFPVFASPKLDGIRASVVGGKLLTRSLKEVPNRVVFDYFSKTALEGLDGELIVGDPTAADVYRNTVSGIMSRDGNPEFTYYAFDIHNAKTEFSRRLEMLYESFDGLTVVQILPQVLISNADDLLSYEAYIVNSGYEGVILRAPSSPYKYGRSTAREGYLLKLKRFEDSEALVLEVIEEMHNGNEAKTNALGRTERSSHKDNKIGKGRMGALLVRDLKTGVEFQIGTGFNDSDRAWWWEQRHAPMPPVVKYKFFPVGVKTKPRHPVFIGLRDPKDMS